ncbi:MAG: phage tail protein, partial [Rhodocyclaceae bacterium]|nr:phage tail protein [Rhodocyclaceae bacterium]
GYRGITSVLWQGIVSAMNPYIKPWRFRVKRIPRAWNASLAEINGDANPAHILRECLTNRDWGMGYPDVDIDETSFAAAAGTLYSEGFGLSILWDQETSIEDFVRSILHHIDASLYVHPRTGKFTLKLTREDYNVASLITLSPANVLALEEFSRRGWGELVNQVTVRYRDGPTDKDASITVQDIAAIEMQGGIVASSMTFPGISNGTLAARVAMRELRQLSANIAKVRLVANRQASGLSIGDCFKFSWPAYGVQDVVFRIARIDYGTYGDGRVRIEAVEDVFGLPTAVYTAPPPSGWTDPISAPAPCPAQMLYEIPYWQYVKELVGEAQALLAEIDDNEGMVAALGSRPSADAYGYNAYEWRGNPYNQWTPSGSGTFAPTAIVSAALPQAATDITVTLTQAVDLDRVTAYDWMAIIDDEWLWVTGINTSSNQVTLSRGVIDTVPATHAAGARIWFVQPHYIGTQYVVGDTAQVRLCPRTAKGELGINSATTLTRAINRRFTRPYPPGNVTLNAQRYPVAVAGTLTIAWANRNRVNQTANVIKQTDGNITPETGQTTTIRIYGGATLSTLRRTYAGLTGTSQAWTLADAIADGAGGDNRIRIEIEATRSGYASLQKHVIDTDRAGYGLQYGKYYGGV